MPDKDSRYVLAIDNGTQSVRALVFDEHGAVIAKSKVDIEPYVSPQPGWAEQDAEYYWTALCQACQELWPMLDFPREQLAAVSITCQRSTVVPVDLQGDALRPAITWLDQRQVESKPALGPFESLAMQVVGAKRPVDNFHAESEANWIAQHEPEIWARVHKFLLLSGYHTLRLTGHYRDAVASQVGYLPFDFKLQQWAKASDWKWRALAIEEDMLPDLLPAGATLGGITEQASAETGIPEGLPLIASGSDKACEVLGAGCIASDYGSLSYGTTATFNIAGNRYLEAFRFHPAYPGVIPGSYNTEAIVFRGYWMVSWFKREFAQREQQLAAERGVPTESLFDALLASVPPGALGLTLQPYWTPGPGSRGPEEKGAIIGFGEVHTRAHVYRAMIEGITYALREGKERLEKRSGETIQKLRVSGGGSQSDNVMQITADIFGMPVERPHTYEASGLGAAIAAAVGAGIYSDFASATANMTHSGDRFAPIAENQKIYEQLYQQVYRKMYRGLRQPYRAIRSITGYPA